MGKTIPSQGVLRSRKLRNENLKQDPTCRVCGKTKTVADFPKTAVDYACNDCRRIDAVRRYREKVASMSEEELQAYRAKRNKRQTEARNQRLDRMSETELAEYKAETNKGNLERRLAVRHEAYMAYGGYQCNCCGEQERKFLSIDHIHNDGAEHKRKERIHTGEQMYRWLKRHKYPPGFQILCMNCNWGKRMNNGVCPHQERKV